MAFVIGLLTFIMVLDCLILVLLVLIQLPKKEAGAGLAFGGAATDALFGAGSGNVLTKATKYTAVAFFILSLVLSLLQSRFYHRSSSEFLKELNQQSQQPAAPAPAAPPGNPAPAASEPVTPLEAPATNLLLNIPTNAPAPAPAATTNAPAAPQ
jgi:preprotein translocase subunit SecG